MAKELPKRFERDFFKHEKEQRSWDDLVVGETYDTEPFLVTEDRIKQYIEGTEDYNPIFTDQEVANKSQFEGLIAPPTIVVPIVFASMPPESWVKMPGAINPGQNLTFGVPVRAGDTISSQATLVDKYIKRDKKYAIAEFTIKNQNDELVCFWEGGLVLQYQGNEETVNK